MSQVASPRRVADEPKHRSRTGRQRGQPSASGSERADRYERAGRPLPLFLVRPGWDIGSQPTMVRTQSRACALSVTSGKHRCSSTTPAGSPPSFQARRIAAVSSSTTSMPGSSELCAAKASHDRAMEARCPPTAPLRAKCKLTEILSAGKSRVLRNRLRRRTEFAKPRTL
jgi:hypothetical protein